MTATAAASASAKASASASSGWADALLASFAQAGYVRAEPPILQPAEPFLDLSGEDIRRSLYLTTDASGEELCLRPDLTIPVARDYLASPKAGQPAGFSYLGPVFRYRADRPSEFLQAGIESFGRQDRAAADAEMLALALEATSAFGVGDVEIKTGDVLAKISGGGGGVGLPTDRPPEFVALDVKNEMISVEAASKIYGVAVDPVTFAVDQAQTKRLRSGSQSDWDVVIDEQTLAVGLAPHKAG